uniref:Uncharacterized protein n=1 Tax=Arundo donax TaxID=35708 RepID=A0A0A9BK82_ARUDO
MPASASSRGRHGEMCSHRRPRPPRRLHRVLPRRPLLPLG